MDLILYLTCAIGRDMLIFSLPDILLSYTAHIVCIVDILGPFFPCLQYPAKVDIHFISPSKRLFKCFQRQSMRQFRPTYLLPKEVQCKYKNHGSQNVNFCNIVLLKTDVSLLSFDCTASSFFNQIIAQIC